MYEIGIYLLFVNKMCCFPTMFPEDLYSVLSVVIILCTLVESYIFPFAVLKWIIIVTKYGGLLKYLRRKNKHSSPIKSCYKYNLELLTLCKTGKLGESNELVSHVSVTVEANNSDFKWIQLSYCEQDCQKIPPALGKMYGAKTQHLDLSYNCIETLKGLEQFIRLQELILDNNKLGDAVSFPYLPQLRTLSLNNNQITDLELLIDKILKSFPSLTYLSLLSNKACPNQLSDLDKDDSDYQRYRYYAIYRLPKLQFLDSRVISLDERREAMTRGEFMRVRRPRDDASTNFTSPPAPRPLPVNLAELGKHKGAYGKCHYKYTGKHSEGNRFIVNSDL